MSIGCLVIALAVGLTLPVSHATAQQPANPADSAQAELRSTLRAFYFSLAHRATRPPGGVLPTASASATDPPTCSSANDAPVDNAVILLRDDWAEVSVARCGAAAGADRFRLIHFEGRWWIVFIDLFQEPAVVQVAR